MDSLMKKYIFLFFIFVLSTAFCTAEDDFSSFDDVPSDYVLVDQPLAWYLNIIKTPGSYVLIKFCDTWDWLKLHTRVMVCVIKSFFAYAHKPVKVCRPVELEKGIAHGGA